MVLDGHFDFSPTSSGDNSDMKAHKFEYSVAQAAAAAFGARSAKRVKPVAPVRLSQNSYKADDEMLRVPELTTQAGQDQDTLSSQYSPSPPSSSFYDSTWEWTAKPEEPIVPVQSGVPVQATTTPNAYPVETLATSDAVNYSASQTQSYIQPLQPRLQDPVQVQPQVEQPFTMMNSYKQTQPEMPVATQLESDQISSSSQNYDSQIGSSIRDSRKHGDARVPKARHTPVWTKKSPKDIKALRSRALRLTILWWILAVCAVFFAWASFGLMMRIGFLPTLDLGYSWFDSHITFFFGINGLS
ncbi:hypothetical protein [Bombiscardovia coagulans]|uniref:Sortase family protein n=1 Tax=Bombiscardovia coagulans TaxID=686666 RepID=A0A261EQD1_9BIFI|nr:hypothetical protein [Bombiscardovia coagulans]OZG49054.1 Sortase family protein [Bombiscardovia coagulans]